MALMQCPSALSAPTLMGYLHAYNAILQAPQTMRRVDVVLAATSNDASSGLRRCSSTATIDIDMMALMLCPSALSVPTLMGYLHAYNAILQSPHTMRKVDVVLAASPNQHSSGHRRGCITSTIDNESMALMQCPSVLPAPTLMGHFCTLKAILTALHTIGRLDVVLAATPNDASSRLRRHCSTSTMDNDIMALMLCPSALSAPTLMGHFYAYNAILRSPHTMRRVDVVLAATSNDASSGLRRRGSTATIDKHIMALMLCPSGL